MGLEKAKTSEEKRIDAMVDDIINSHALREKYDGLFRELIEMWEASIYYENVYEMLGILREAGKRIVGGRSSRVSNVATYLVAACKSKKCGLTAMEVAKLLETFGLMFRCGGLVINNINKNFKDPVLVNVSGNVSRADAMFRDMRKRFGKSSETELDSIRCLFGLD